MVRHAVVAGDFPMEIISINDDGNKYVSRTCSVQDEVFRDSNGVPTPHNAVLCATFAYLQFER